MLRLPFAFATTLLAVADISWRNGGVEGHAALSTPMGRQFYALKEGKTTGDGDIANYYPVKEYSPYGMQAGGETYGACGRRRFDDDVDDYTWNYVSAFGDPVPWRTQAVYEEGQVIEVEVTVAYGANHKGHFEMSVCLDWENPTQACFDENPMLFIDDVYNGAAPDPNYPFRGYMAPGGVPGQVNNDDGQLIKHRYKLPEGINGERVLLQWHWVSALGCKSVGYPDYDWPDHWGENGSGTTCTYPLPDFGNDPQQYWHCAEISIFPKDGTPWPTTEYTPRATPSPVVTPVTPSPVTNPGTPVTPAPIAVAPCGQCGPQDGKNQPECNGQTETRCNEMIQNENKCQWNECTTPSPNPPTPPVTEAPVAATSSPVSSSPTMSPSSSNPTESPVAVVATGSPTPDAEYCCTHDAFHCSLEESCNADMSTCHGVCGGSWMATDSPAMQCISKWGTCTGELDSCCESLTCFGYDDTYRQCL